MKVYISAVILAILNIVGAHQMKSGACPAYESNLSSERFNGTKIGGLWFEYLYDKDFKEDLSYECASWNLLWIEEGRYEVLKNAINRTSDDVNSVMSRHKLNCGFKGNKDNENPQKCTYVSTAAPSIIHEWTLNRPRTFQIVDTDMFSYAVVSACYDYKLMHQEQFLVLTREKQPSMYTKKQILNALQNKLKLTDSQIQDLEKGNIFDCWGEDRHL